MGNGYDILEVEGERVGKRNVVGFCSPDLSPHKRNPHRGTTEVLHNSPTGVKRGLGERMAVPMSVSRSGDEPDGDHRY